MTMLEQVTPVILTLNEEDNIGRTLGKLYWAGDIVVVDSMSTDGTRDICCRYPQVRFIKRPFDCHSGQWNYAIEQTGVRTPWILALDADYVLTDELITELRNLDPAAQTVAYYARFDFSVYGKILPGTVYPPVAVLFRAGRATYIQDGHTQRLAPAGRTGWLKNRIVLDDRKPLTRWIASQAKYAALEADRLATVRFRDLAPADKVRRFLVLAPPAMFMYALIAKRGFLAGRNGLFYALQRAAFEVLLSLYLLDAQLVKLVEKDREAD